MFSILPICGSKLANFAFLFTSFPFMLHGAATSYRSMALCAALCVRTLCASPHTVTHGSSQ